MHAFCVPKPFCSARKRQGSILPYNNHHNKKAPCLLSHHAFRTEFPQGWRAQARPHTLTLTSTAHLQRQLFAECVCASNFNPQPKTQLNFNPHTQKTNYKRADFTRETRSFKYSCASFLEPNPPATILVLLFLNLAKATHFLVLLFRTALKDWTSRSSSLFNTYHLLPPLREPTCERVNVIRVSCLFSALFHFQRSLRGIWVSTSNSLHWSQIQEPKRHLPQSGVLCINHPYFQNAEEVFHKSCSVGSSRVPSILDFFALVHFWVYACDEKLRNKTVNPLDWGY